MKDVGELSRVLHELYNARSGTPPSMKGGREGEMSGCSFVRWTLLLCHEEEEAAHRANVIFRASAISAAIPFLLSPTLSSLSLPSAFSCPLKLYPR